MQRLPIFFHQYDLNADADERALKRVYARELKKIDQEHDLTGFQELRQNYEEALAWLKQRELTGSQEEIEMDEAVSAEAGQQGSHHPATDGTTVPESMPAADPEEMAQLVFEEMLKDMRAHVDDEDYAGKRLLQTLDDERLIHMETRLNFEKVIAYYLLQGWQPGNGELFDVAVEQFGWKKDRRRLLDWGQAGHILSRALFEQAEFHKKSSTIRDGQWALLKKARTEAVPEHAYLKVHFSLIQRMVDLYPTWVVMVSNKQNIEQWYKVVETMHQREVRISEPQVAYVEQSEQTGTGSKGKQKFLLGFFLCMLLVALFSGNSTVTPTSTGETGWSVNDELLPADILFRKGQDYFSGHGGMPVNISEAFRYWKLASDKGYANATYHMAWITDLGNGVRSDHAQAYKWYEIAAEQGNIRSQALLGDYYFYGRDKPKNMAKAFHFYQMAALQGHAPSQVQLAVMYDEGLGVEKNPEKALALIQSAAESKDANAEANLGNFYLNGQYGLPKDMDKAAFWLLRSAEQNSTMGQRLLASMYERGFGTQAIDLDRASTWYARAAKKGDKTSQDKLKLICKKGNYTVCRGA
ncbi:tetratricopeptide repeat protein [Undibacterium sp. TS12]|uniref:tetratricopeptide repeat protein n=1 Tax=Undibacterium sp. TS12 TaxID=2908202 RepID=UPI001F4C77AA|nr:tetratricopeptide repeat protein [Undibacterium sp. TS12]MCH8622576.1 sel1 repeat family protein [Undibacterium sp. TS12]